MASHIAPWCTDDAMWDKKNAIAWMHEQSGCGLFEFSGHIIIQQTTHASDTDFFLFSDLTNSIRLVFPQKVTIDLKWTLRSSNNELTYFSCAWDVISAKISNSLKSTQNQNPKVLLKPYIDSDLQSIIVQWVRGNHFPYGMWWWLVSRHVRCK